MNIAFALTGSFCTIQKVLPVIEKLSENHSIYSAVSEIVASTDTRFGEAGEIMDRLRKASGKKIITSISQAEKFGPSNVLDILVIAPATGNTLGKIANGITDTCVTMLAKAHLRNNKPLLLAISTNDGLSRSALNIAKLANMKNVYFVPYGQDDPAKKPFSLISKPELIEEAIKEAIAGKQMQPLLV